MSLTSLTEHVENFDAGAEIVGARFFSNGAPALALASGAVLIGAPGASKTVQAHEDGAILCAVGDGRILVSGGDDGLDEISITGPTKAVSLQDGAITELTITTELLGVSRPTLYDLMRRLAIQ